MSHTGGLLACNSSLESAAAATMAWCGTRGSLSGHSLRLNLNELYCGLYQLRESMSRTVCPQENMSRPLCPRDKLTSLARLSCAPSKPPLLLFQAIRCTHPTCPCECFAPGKQSLRYCDTCNHGWVAHALDKLGPNPSLNLGLQVEVVQPNIVFDIASLMLYGAQAAPVRLKILLDRLFSVLQHQEVLQVLHGFGWTYEDYARGYILQDTAGRVLDKWCMATREEELVVLQQFLRFGETKAIAQEIILQDGKDRHEQLIKQTPRAESDIKKFIERSNLSMQNYLKSYESTRQLFGGPRPGPFIPAATRMITSPVISPNFSPGREPRALALVQTPTTSSTPIATPILARLPAMQPFDARKELPSPVVSVSPAMDKSLMCRSPVCDSPKNIMATNLSIISTSSTPPTQQILLQQDQLKQNQSADESSLDGYPSDSEDEGEALDYSNKDNPGSLADGDRKNKQHMRKSSNPIKRQWTPSANFGSTFVGPNGKKRVLCTACNKTFCDKGALKIHYSAVHLKEMHKCTVEGCSMMFSSRRSRNRHSANPNPKLHMPQKKKDELDASEDMDMSASNGASTGPGTPPISLSAPSVVSSVAASVLPLLESPRVIRPDTNFFIEMSSQFPFIAGPPEKRIKMETEQPTDIITIVKTEEKQTTEVSRLVIASLPEDEPCDLSKKFDEESKLEIDLDAAGSEREDVRKEDEGEISENGYRNEDAVRGGKRRKNTAPIRCSQSEAASDDNSEERESHTGAGQLTVLTCSPDMSLNLDTVAAKFYVAEFQDGHRGLVLQSSDVNRQTDMTQRMPALKDRKQEALMSAMYSQSLQEKRSDGSEARNFPKIASLLWSQGLQNVGVSEKIKQEILQEQEDNSVQDEDDQMAGQEDEDEDDSEEESSDNDQETPHSEAHDIPAEMYVDSSNPLKCKVCGKVFQNSFTVKIHFKNVHLKVQHPCTVDGCSATFPSKRSRDRHSANLNLHRRLLTGESQTGKEVDEALRGNILVQLYGHDVVTANVVSSLVSLDGQHTNNNNIINNINNNNIISNNNNNDEDHPKPEPRFIYPVNIAQLPLTPAVGTPLNLAQLPLTPAVSTPVKMTAQQLHVSKPGSAGSEDVSEDSDEGGQQVVASHGFKIPCKVCGDKFSTPAILQEHISISHPDHGLTLPDPAVKRIVSPRRARSRQKSVTSLART